MSRNDNGTAVLDSQIGDNMSDGKIHIPARSKQPVDQQTVVKLSPEAYNVLVDIYNESALSLKQIASILIVESAKRVVYDKES